MASLFPPPHHELLPEFTSLLITGSYHSSAPIHLALSCTHHQSVIISSSRPALSQNLQQSKDAWLTAKSGHGSTALLSSKITVFYPPTAAHLCLLLAVLCIPTTDDTGPGFISTTLENVQGSPPIQIILVEPSKLVINADSSPPPTLSSYFSFLNRIFVSTISPSGVSWSALLPNIAMSLVFLYNALPLDSPPRKLVAFDSSVNDLKLSIINQPSDLQEDDEKVDHAEAEVLPLVETLFQWVGIFEDDPMHIPSSQGEEVADEGIQRQLRMYKPNIEEHHVMSWREIVVQEGVAFVWN